MVVGEATVGEATVGEATVGEATVGEATVGEAPVGEAKRLHAFSQNARFFNNKFNRGFLVSVAVAIVR